MRGMIEEQLASVVWNDRQRRDPVRGALALGGSLLLNGHGTMSANSTSFHGQASATPQASDNLAGLLNLLGRPTGDGTVALDFNR